MTEALTTANNALNLLLVGIGLYLANNFRRQLQLKMVDRRLESYSRLWELMKDSGPWRTESGRGWMSFEERVELYDKMSSWYYGQGNGMLLTPVTRELYLNAKVNMICDNKDLRLNLNPDELEKKLQSYLKPDEQENYHSRNPKDPEDEVKKQWRGRLSMEQLSLLRAQMRADLQVFGLIYKYNLEPLEKAFLEAANINLQKKPWKKPRTNPWRKPWTPQRRIQRDRPIPPAPEEVTEPLRLIVAVHPSGKGEGRPSRVATGDERADGRDGTERTRNSTAAIRWLKGRLPR